MRFNVAVVTPPGFPFTHFFFDSVRMLRGAIEGAGRPCTVTHNVLERDRVNVIVGIHTLTDPGLLDSVVDRNLDVVVLNTEMVRGKGFNGVVHDARWNDFVLPLLQRARGVWDSSPENMAALASHGVESEMLRFGWVPELEGDVRHDQEKDLDFYFCGSITPHRREVLDRLADLGYRVAVAFDDAPFFRNANLSRAEVLPTLRQNDLLTHVPQARILHLVANGCLVAGEGGENQAPVEDLFVHTSANDVVDLLRRTRARADRRALAESFRARLRTRPMAAMVAPLLDALDRQPSSPSWRTVRGLAVGGAGGHDHSTGSAPAKQDPPVGTACARGAV